MAAGAQQRLAEQLKKVSAALPDLQALALLRSNATLVTVDNHTGQNRERLASMAIASMGLSEQIVYEFQRGEVEQIYIRGRTGYILMFAAGHGAFFLALVDRDAKMGLILLELRRFAHQMDWSG